MLLQLHEKYTKIILDKFVDTQNVNDLEQILIGSLANDLCSFTNEYVMFKLKKYYSEKKKKGLFDDSAFYQSHWGNFSALHCMAEKEGINTIDTHRKILQWLDFLEFIIFNNKEEILMEEINQFEMLLGTQVKNITFKIYNLFDTKELNKARFRALGMIVHIIQDSYTISHCSRDKENNIESFHYYKTQTYKSHKKFDKIKDEHTLIMLQEIEEVLEIILNGTSAKNNYIKIFKLSGNTKVSSNGNLV